MTKSYFTSESVTRGHPDKVCDQIADRILDEHLRQDPEAHVACEVTCSPDSVHIFGEITSEAEVDCEATARSVISEIGYTRPGHGFDAESCRITVELHRQSPDIARGVVRQREKDRLDNGAGDQGMMFGFACRQTETLMPLPIELAHALAKKLEAARTSSELPYLLPDGKTQVTVEYDGSIPVRIATVVVSAQHEEDVTIEQLREEILSHVILPALPAAMVDHRTEFFINPTGRFAEGGPAADSGLTGRKIIVDTYGGYARHGGGAFSGKDASKVDRTGAYLARYMAKNLVAARLADTCEIQISYAIGLAEPVSVLVNTFGTGNAEDEELQDLLCSAVDLRPGAAIERFSLKKPRFSSISCYGHFGSNASQMPWEQTDLSMKMK